MYEEAALREQLRVAGDVLESLTQQLAGTIFLLEAAKSAMNQGEVLSLITQAKEALREGLREARNSASDLLPRLESCAPKSGELVSANVDERH